MRRTHLKRYRTEALINIDVDRWRFIQLHHSGVIDYRSDQLTTLFLCKGAGQQAEPGLAELLTNFAVGDGFRIRPT